LKKHIDAIKNVQRHFTKRIAARSELTYPERLALLDLEPLELRRLKFDLIQYYIILNKLSPIQFDDHFQLCAFNQSTPIHIFAETTQNIGWIRPEFVVQSMSVVGLIARLHTEFCQCTRTRQMATLVRRRLSVFIVERVISIDGAPVNSRVLKSRY
jgi:hypothetical protein